MAHRFSMQCFSMCVYHISNNCSVCEMNTMAYFDWTHVESWQFLFNSSLLHHIKRDGARSISFVPVFGWLDKPTTYKHKCIHKWIKGNRGIYFLHVNLFHVHFSSIWKSPHLKHIKDWRSFQCSLTLNSIYLPFRFSISLLVFKLLEIRDLQIQWINQLIEAQPHEMNELKTQWEWVSWMKEKEKETNETKNNQKIIENKTNAYRFQNELHSQCLHGPTSVVNRKRTHALADHFVRAKVT